MKEKESIRTLKGVGEKTEKLFQKVGISTVGQLLRYYPRDYDIYREPVTVESLNDQETGAVLATLTSSLDMKKVRNLTVISGTIADASGRCRVTWFNQPYLRNQLRRGMTFVFRGKISKKGNLSVMEQPEVCTPAAYEEKLNSMQPKYALTAGLSNNMVTKMVRAALEQLDLSQDYLPEEIRLEYELAEYNFAAVQIHFPSGQEQYLEARKRLAFDEFLLFIMGLKQLKEQNAADKNHYRMKEVWKTEEVMENLPYQLTGAQKNVWYEIEQDLRGEKLMTRLVQGDVGSGKTIVAFLAMIMTAENGYQSAIMVPTEVLARQHYEALTKLLEENELLEQYRPVLLTGSNTAKEKRQIYEAIASGTTRMIVGTHALIQEKVTYESLGLVITDEQHRFGVRQREEFSSKGQKPNILVMSATPIPRTLGIILYGDLDISIIDELPAQRLPIKNCVVDTNYRNKAYRFIEKQVQEGHQVYVICPMVEESEGMDGENVIDYAERLRHELSSFVTVGILHGKMKPKEKNEIMEAFSSFLVVPLTHFIPLDILFASTGNPHKSFRCRKVSMNVNTSFAERIFSAICFNQEHSRPTTANAIPIVYTVRIEPFTILAGFFIQNSIALLIKIILKGFIHFPARIIWQGFHLLCTLATFRMMKRSPFLLVYKSIFYDKFAP